MEVLRSVSRFWSRQAIVTETAECRYQALASAALQVANLINVANAPPKPTDENKGKRVAIMAQPGSHFVQSVWGAWLSGGIAVPLCLSHPPRELQYVLEEAQVSVVLATKEYAETLGPLADSARVQARWHFMAWISGHTLITPGVLHTHGSVGAMIRALVTAWEWQPDDRILHALPLHHTHGIINALFCAHAAGASVNFLQSFSPTQVWNQLQADEAVTIFMGVPTMYTYLLNAYDKMDEAERTKAQDAVRRLRLTVCGSSACPLPVMERWHKLSGQTLLERYGMTETGMILSNPLHGERRPGFVGLPLPGVKVRSEMLRGGEKPQEGQQAEGELLVAGDAVFQEYWNCPDATAEAFDANGHFRTGDTAAMEGEPSYWRILGRTSVDIIKSGGYKISALGIEDVLLKHPAVADCAVMGTPHPALGEQISVVAACHSGQEVSLEELQAVAKEHLPPYQVPHNAQFVPEIPRNAMGKINKKQLVKDMFPVE